MTEVQRLGLIGAAIALVIILAAQTWLVNVAKRRAKALQKFREVRFMDLLVTSDDESYSLSRLQIYAWTVAVIVGFSAVFAATRTIPEIKQNLYLLMGVNIASAVTSNAIRTTKNLQKNVGAPPDFIKDIFFDSEASLDLPRTQMAIWTIISLIVFFYVLVESFTKTTPPLLPDITSGLVILMGLSNGAYLGAKATDPASQQRAQTATSPVISQALPPKIPPTAPK